MAVQRGTDGLTELERAVCLALDRGLSDRAAYREARPYSTANDHTARNLAGRIRRRPHCAAFLRRLRFKAMQRHARSKDRVIQELANIAFSDLSDLIDWGPHGVTVRYFADLTPAQRRLVSKVSVTRTAQGETLRIEMHDKMSAFDKLCKLLGLYAADARFKPGRDDAAETRPPLSDVERAQRLAAILRLGGGEKTMNDA